jgi:hypothetical protein
MYRLFLLSALIGLSMFTGCASTVKSSVKTQSLKEGAPHAVIKEENLKENFVTSGIKGVYTSPENYPDTYETFLSTNSMAGDIGKLAFGLTPWGLIANAIYLDKGRTIAVPPGKVGLLIYHHYYKVLSIKDINYFKYGKTYRGTVITYESRAWDTTVWATLDPNKEYVFKLSALKLIGPGGEIVPIENTAGEGNSSGKSQLKTNEKIQDEKGNDVPKQEIQEVKVVDIPKEQSSNAEKAEKAGE